MHFYQILICMEANVLLRCKRLGGFEKKETFFDHDANVYQIHHVLCTHRTLGNHYL